MEQVPDQNMDAENVTPPAAPLAEEPKKPAAFGSVLGIILIVAILVAGAFYVWNERLEMSDDTSEDMQGGVRGEMLPDGSMPTVEGAADVEAGPEGPIPQ